MTSSDCNKLLLLLVDSTTTNHHDVGGNKLFEEDSDVRVPKVAARRMGKVSAESFLTQRDVRPFRAIPILA